VSHWQQSSPDAERRLGALAELFARSRAAFFDIAQDEHHWLPRPGSLAEGDIGNGELGPAGPWGDQPVWRTINVVANYLLTATGHLGGLAVLHAGQEVMFSPPALVRSVIENCAHAFWVLGLDEPRRTRVRVARAHLEELESAEHDKAVRGWLSGESGESYQARPLPTASYATRSFPACSLGRLVRLSAPSALTVRSCQSQRRA